MYKTLLFLLVFCLLGKLTSAQQVIFFHSEKNKVFTINIGTKLMLAYKGYNGNLEYCSQLVTEITDSTITLGSAFIAQGANNKMLNAYKVINLKDITAFRKRSLTMELSKTLLQAGLIVGSYFMYDYITKDMSNGAALLTTLGTGLAINLAISAAFRENTKYQMANGWQYRYVNAATDVK